MSKIITLQPSPVVDNITADGRELTRLPYPYHVTEDGDVTRQDFWQGEPYGIVGFQLDPNVQRVNVWWDDVVADPQLAVGKYAVLRQTSGLSTLLMAIESVTVTEV